MATLAGGWAWLLWSHMFLPVVTCHNRPSEAQRFRFGGLQAALQAAPFACME
ncbi:MAG: hypothetical protein ACI307_08435 [Sodaliphilus sp.]